MDNVFRIRINISVKQKYNKCSNNELRERIRKFIEKEILKDFYIHRPVRIPIQKYRKIRRAKGLKEKKKAVRKKQQIKISPKRYKDNDTQWEEIMWLTNDTINSEEIQCPMCKETIYWPKELNEKIEMWKNHNKKVEIRCLYCRGILLKDL